MMTSSGKPVKHTDLLKKLLTATHLPKAVAVCKCAAYQTGAHPVTLGNAKADKVAKEAGTEKHGVTTNYALIEIQYP